MSFLFPAALLVGLVLTVLSLSLLALWRAKVLQGTVERRMRQEAEPDRLALQALAQRLDGVAAQIADWQGSSESPLVRPKAGLNLGKRSQALRMHRRGEPAEQIAAALGIPRQEVELLLKVHRIVMSNI